VGHDPPNATCAASVRCTTSGLRRHSSRFLGDRILVTEIPPAELALGLAISPHRHHVWAQLVHHGNPRGDVELSDLVVGDLVQVLDEGSERVAVSCDKEAFACFDLRLDEGLPPRYDTIHRVLKTLGQRHHFAVESRIDDTIPGVVLVGLVLSRGRDIVRTAPNHDLLCTMFSRSFGLVQSSEGAIMSLVQMPVFVNWDP